MNTLRRVWAELLDPYLKCQRVGHKVRIWSEMDLGLQILRTKTTKIAKGVSRPAKCERCRHGVVVYGYIREAAKY